MPKALSLESHIVEYLSVVVAAETDLFKGFQMTSEPFNLRIYPALLQTTSRLLPSFAFVPKSPTAFLAALNGAEQLI